jgi:hypothetical protein
LAKKDDNNFNSQVHGWSINLLIGIIYNEKLGPDLLRCRDKSINGGLIPLDEMLGPNLLKGRGKSIYGDLDIDDEGFEQNFEPLQSLHHRSVGYQSVWQIDIIKKDNPYKRNREHKQERSRCNLNCG